MYSVVDQIGARTLWDVGITGAGVNVAVVDTGVMPTPALSDADKVIAVVDLSTDAELADERYLDAYGHGTHMAGIILGRDPGADPATAAAHPAWFMGVAPDAGLVSVKVASADGGVAPSQVIAGIDWVIEHADELEIGVLNLSFSSESLHTYLSDPLTAAAERAWDAGIVVVVAAGNDGTGELRLSSPANDPDVISVGGLAADGAGAYTIPDWATNGNGIRNPDIGAPGEQITSLRSEGSWIDEEYPAARQNDMLTRGSGSSQAAAVVSGAVALVLQAHPDWTPDEVKASLTRSADETNVPAGTEFYRGEGSLRVDLAVDASVTASTQVNVPSVGDGSLAGVRGLVLEPIAQTSFIQGLFGILIPIITWVLPPDLNILGSEWDSDWTGTRWAGGTWDGTRWASADWMGTRWAGASWMGAEWSGTRWAAQEWAGTRWAGTHWTGTRWAGTRWAGTRWAGTRWAGNEWSGTRWSSGEWA